MNCSWRLASNGRLTSTIFLIEPQALVVEALRFIYARDATLRVVGDSPSLDQELIARLRPDVIVLDIDELVGPMEDVINACERASPQSRVCVISTQSRTRILLRALAARAAAYVLKDTSPDLMIEVVHTVARGDFYADPKLAGAMLRRRTSRPVVGNELSTREFEIVRLIADGMSNREIGNRLALSEKTVKNHVSHVLAKLRVSARSGIAVYAVRNGIVQ